MDTTMVKSIDRVFNSLVVSKVLSLPILCSNLLTPVESVPPSRRLNS
jgi:hypothetical protein